MTIWDEVLSSVREKLPEDDFRRWFGATAYASDSGDQISVWISTEAIRRHVVGHFQRHIDEALEALDRRDTHVRFIVAGVSEDEDDV